MAATCNAELLLKSISTHMYACMDNIASYVATVSSLHGKIFVVFIIAMFLICDFMLH